MFGYVAIDPLAFSYPGLQLGEETIENSLRTSISFSPSFVSPRIMVTQNDDN